MIDAKLKENSVDSSRAKLKEFSERQQARLVCYKRQLVPKALFGNVDIKQSSCFALEKVILWFNLER